MHNAVAGALDLNQGIRSSSTNYSQLFDEAMLGLAALLLNSIDSRSSKDVGDLFAALKAEGHRETILEPALDRMWRENLIQLGRRLVKSPSIFVEYRLPERVFVSREPPSPPPEPTYLRIAIPLPALREWWNDRQTLTEDEFANVNAAVTQLRDFVLSHSRMDCSDVDYARLLKLDQRVFALCQVATLSIPKVAHIGVWSEFTPHCHVPISRYSGHMRIHLDRGWEIAMQSLEDASRIKGQKRATGGNGMQLTTNPMNPIRFDAKPASYRPDDKVIEAAKLAVVIALNCASNEPGEPSPITPDRVVNAGKIVRIVAESGHRQDAVEWAIHDFVSEGKLTTDGRFMAEVHFEGNPPPAILQRHKPPANGQPATFDLFVVRTTPALWEWWTRSREKAKPKSGGRKPLEKSSPVKHQIYRRIRDAHKPGQRRSKTVELLLQDPILRDQVRAEGLTLNEELVRLALAFFCNKK